MGSNLSMSDRTKTTGGRTAPNDPVTVAFGAVCFRTDSVRTRSVSF